MKKTPLFIYSVALLAAALVQCVLAIPVSLMADGVLIKEMLFYLSGLLATIPPFLMLGYAAFLLTTGRFASALFPFWLYLGLSVVKQPLLSLLIYLVDENTDFVSTLLSGLLNELIYAALLFLLLLLGYLLFVRGRRLLADDRFFTLLSTDGRVLLLAVGVTFVLSLVSEIWGIALDISARLGLVDLIDIGNYLFAILYVCATAALSYTVGRALQLRCAREVETARN